MFHSRGWCLWQSHKSETYWRRGKLPAARITFSADVCVPVLRNGFTVTGESACASPENFDAEIGRKIARQNAVNKIWMLEGYLLKQTLSEQ
ncbi:Gp49 family protein [Escherichia coli]|uniref:Gp49 family protein n=1 Tax=Escherichia coli TaxID=562 RepID=UPI003D05381C